MLTERTAYTVKDLLHRDLNVSVMVAEDPTEGYTFRVKDNSRETPVEDGWKDYTLRELAFTYAPFIPALAAFLLP